MTGNSVFQMLPPMAYFNDICAEFGWETSVADDPEGPDGIAVADNAPFAVRVPVALAAPSSRIRLLAVGAASDVPANTRLAISYDQVQGARYRSLSKLPPAFCASPTASSSKSAASVGTSDLNPILGGSTDGCVKFP